MLHDARSLIFEEGSTIYLSLEKDRQMKEFRGLYEIMDNLWTSVGPTYSMTLSKHGGLII